MVILHVVISFILGKIRFIITWNKIVSCKLPSIVIEHVRIFQFSKYKVVLMSPAHITAKCTLARCNKYAHLSQPCDWFSTVHTASRGLASVCWVRGDMNVRLGKVARPLYPSHEPANGRLFSTRLGCKNDSNLGYTLRRSTFVKSTDNSADRMKRIGEGNLEVDCVFK